MKIAISGIQKADLHKEENAYKILVDQKIGGWVYLFEDMSESEIEWNGMKAWEIPSNFNRKDIKKWNETIVDELREFLWNNQDETIFPDSLEIEI